MKVRHTHAFLYVTLYNHSLELKIYLDGLEFRINRIQSFVYRELWKNGMCKIEFLWNKVTNLNINLDIKKTGVVYALTLILLQLIFFDL